MWIGHEAVVHHVTQEKRAHTLSFRVVLLMSLVASLRPRPRLARRAAHTHPHMHTGAAPARFVRPRPSTKVHTAFSVDARVRALARFFRPHHVVPGVDRGWGYDRACAALSALMRPVSSVHPPSRTPTQPQPGPSPQAHGRPFE